MDMRKKNTPEWRKEMGVELRRIATFDFKLASDLRTSPAVAGWTSDKTRADFLAKLRAIQAPEPKPKRRNQHQWGVVGSHDQGDVSHCPLCNKFNVNGGEPVKEADLPDGITWL